MLKRSFVILAMVSAAQFARAEIKVEVLPAEQVMKRQQYTVSIPETTVAEVIDGFKKQTELDLTIDNPQRTGGPALLASLDFKDLDRNAALDALGRAISMRVSLDGAFDHPTIRLSQGGSGLMFNNGGDVGRAAGVEIISVGRNQSNPPNREFEQGIVIQIYAYPGPQPVMGGGRIDLIEATDEQGRALTTPLRPRGMMFFGGGGGMMSQPVNLQLSLKAPTPLPKMIKTLKANVVLKRAKTINHVTAEGFADKAITGDYNGGKLTIGPAKVRGQQINLKIRIDRGEMPAEAWGRMNEIYQSVSQISVLDSNGKKWRSLGGGGGGGPNYYEVNCNLRKMDANGNYSGGGDDDQGDTDASATPKPAAKPGDVKLASLTWDTVAETEEVKLPLEASDLPVP